MTNKDGTPRPDTLQDLFSGKLTDDFWAKPEGMRDLEKEPPILSFETQLKGKIIESTTEQELVLPARVYPVQLVSGAGDDAKASAEQNRLWKESLDVVSESLELLWPSAEAAVAAVATARTRAEARRPQILLEFRKRVFEAIRFSHIEPYMERPPDREVDSWLDTLQTDERMFRNLARLEDLVLEVEGCRNELDSRMAEAKKFKEDSDDYRRKMLRCSAMEERLNRAKFDVRTVCETAREMVETDEALKGLSDTIASLNPFR